MGVGSGPRQMVRALLPSLRVTSAPAGLGPPVASLGAGGVVNVVADRPAGQAPGEGFAVVTAALWLARQPAGRYAMAEVLGL